MDVKQIHVNKLSDFLKRLCNFTEVYDFLDSIEKEMKYRSILVSAGFSGFEISRNQKDDVEKNLVSLDEKVVDLEQKMILKM